jgi:flagellar basal body-associated protein FliL
MKKSIVILLFGLTGLLLVSGCVAFPPLISVEHKESANNQEIVKRLDAIDHRLDQLEQKSTVKQ